MKNRKYITPRVTMTARVMEEVKDAMYRLAEQHDRTPSELVEKACVFWLREGRWRPDVE